MADEPPEIVPVVSTENPEGTSATEFGGVGGLVPPASVHTPTAEDSYLIHRNNVRRARRATQYPYGRDATSA